MLNRRRSDQTDKSLKLFMLVLYILSTLWALTLIAVIVSMIF